MASNRFRVPFPFHSAGWLAATKAVAQTRFQEFCLGGKSLQGSVCAGTSNASAPGPRPPACRIYRADRREIQGLGAPESN